MALKNGVAKLTCLVGLALCSAAAHGQVVMSQVYSGGGGGTSTYKYDYIELFNKGNAPVSIGGWSVQYSSATGSFGTSNRFTIPAGQTIAANGYYLIQTGSAGSVGLDLPAPVDATTTQLSMAAGGAKVALLNDANFLAGTCPTGANIVDFLGWGTANCFEGALGPTTSATTAAFRGNDGCTDTNNNATDFAANTPAPRNSASPTHTCGGGTSTDPTGVGASNPADACPGQSVVLTITVTPGTNPASTGIAVSGDTTSIDGAGVQSFVNDGTNGDAVAGDNIWSLTTTIFVSQTGPKVVPVTITDAQSRTGNSSVAVNVLNCALGGFATTTPAGVCPGESTLVTFNVFPGLFPNSTGITATADLTNAGGPAAQQLFDDGSNGDQVAGDNVFSFFYSVPTGLAAGPHALTATVNDAQSRTATRNFTLNTGTCVQTTTPVVISQVYGGGGNTGATLTHDFVELFNRSSSPVDVSGWSIQYASGETDANGFDTKSDIPAGTIIPAGSYLLIQGSAGAGGTQGLPTPFITPTNLLFIGGTRGVIALVNDGTLLGVTDCSGATIVDKVGFGNGTGDSLAYCAEGLRTGALSNTTAVLRRENGCFDTDNNGIDFNINTPAPRTSASPTNVCPGGQLPCGTSDYNGDGDFGTDADIEAFFACLAGNCCPTCYAGGSDFNADGDFGTDADIESFFRVLAGGPC